MLIKIMMLMSLMNPVVSEEYQVSNKVMEYGHEFKVGINQDGEQLWFLEENIIGDKNIDQGDYVICYYLKNGYEDQFIVRKK